MLYPYSCYRTIMQKNSILLMLIELYCLYFSAIKLYLRTSSSALFCLAHPVKKLIQQHEIATGLPLSTNGDCGCEVTSKKNKKRLPVSIWWRHMQYRNIRLDNFSFKKQWNILQENRNCITSTLRYRFSHIRPHEQ